MSLAEIDTQFKRYDTTYTLVDKEIECVETGQCDSPQEVCLFSLIFYNN